jgi:hypothetical protein
MIRRHRHSGSELIDRGSHLVDKCMVKEIHLLVHCSDACCEYSFGVNNLLFLLEVPSFVTTLFDLLVRETHAQLAITV